MISVLMISMPVNFATGDRGAFMSLETLPGHLARRFHQISTALFDIEMERAGLDLTPVQYAALEAVYGQPDIDQVTLSGLIAYDRTTIGGVVDRLVQKGLLTRCTNEIDRRARVLSVSAPGEQILMSARPVVAKAQEQLVSGLDAQEAAELARLLQKAIKALHETSRGAPHL